MKLAAGQAEARAGDLDWALATLDEGLATSERSGHRAFDAELNRVRGDILLMRELRRSRPGRRSVPHRQSPSRSSRARAASKSACRGGAGQTLSIDSSPSRRPCCPRARARWLCADAGNAGDRGGAVFAGGAGDGRPSESRSRAAGAALTQLHVSYGSSAHWRARLQRAGKRRKPSPKPARRRLATSDTPGRLAADYGLWVGSFMRGDLPSMRAHATAFLSDLEARTPICPKPCRTPCKRGHLLARRRVAAQARDYFEKALALFQPGRR